MPVNKVELLLDAAKLPASLETPIGDSEETRLGDMLRDLETRSPEESAIRSDMANEVERAMATLSDREKEVMRLRYGLGNGARVHARGDRTAPLDHARTRATDRSEGGGPDARRSRPRRLEPARGAAAEVLAEERLEARVHVD